MVSFVFILPFYSYGQNDSIKNGKDEASIYFYRKKQFHGAFVRIAININSRTIAFIKSGRRLIVKAKVGDTLIIKVNQGKHEEVRFAPIEGKRYYIETPLPWVGSCIVLHEQKQGMEEFNNERHFKDKKEKITAINLPSQQIKGNWINKENSNLSINELQTIDTLNEHKIDSTIIIKKVKTLQSLTGKTTCYIMNGERISNNILTKRLLIFPSSALEYKKSKRALAILKVFSGILVVDGILMYIPQAPKSFINFELAALAIGGTGGLIDYCIWRHHLNTAIKLYNEEIAKRNK